MGVKCLVLFDGECHFCNASVQFIIKRDPKVLFTFASLQSEIGKKNLAANKLPENLNSMVLITAKNAYLKSSAVLHIAKQLKGLWKLSFILIIIPPPIRDYFYDLLAKNRYRLFGKRTN